MAAPLPPDDDAPRARFGDGLFRLLGLRLVVWALAAQAFLPGVLLDPAKNVAYYHDEHNCVMHEEAARLTLATFHELPAWNPYFCGGIAGIANAPDASLAPDFLLRILFGTLEGRRLTVLFFVMLGMEGTYRWARKNRASALGAAMAGIAFACSGYYVELLKSGWIFMFNYQLVPWVGLAFEEGLRKRRWVVGGGLFLAWLVIGGGTYVVPYTGLALGALLLGETVRALRKADGPRSLPWWRPGATLVGMGVVAAGVSAIRLLPLALLMRGHPRPVDQRDVESPLAVLASLAVPRTHAGWGAHAGDFYVGGIVCLLAVVALLFADRRGAKFFAVAVMFAVFACGEVDKYAPYVFLHKLPVFSQLRFPVRMTVMAALFVALAGARGLTRLEDALASVGAWLVEGSTSLGARAAVVGKLLGGALGVGAAAAIALFAAKDVISDNFVHEGALWVLGPPARVEQPFRQARGNRWDAHVWTFANLGSLHCFEEQALPTSPLLRGDLPQEEYAAPGSDADVERVSWSPHRIVLRVRARGEALVRVNQNWSAAWKTDVGVVEADQRLLAVRVPAGEHLVTLRHADGAVRVGFVITAVSLLLVLRTAARGTRRRLRAWRRLHDAVTARRGSGASAPPRTPPPDAA